MIFNKENGRLITYTLGFAFILKAIAVLFIQQQLEAQMENPTLDIGTIISYVANVLFFISGILGLIYEGKYYPEYVKILFGIILLWVTFVYFRSGASLFDPSTFMSVKGIGPYLGMSVMFTANPIRFHKLFKVFLLVGIILVAGGIANTLNLGLDFDRKEAQMQLRSIAVNLMWISPIVLFNSFKKHKLLAITIFGFSFIFSLFIVTRSFMILHILVLLFFMRFVLKKKIGGLIVIFIVAAAATIYLLPSVGVIEQATNLLIERGNEDTRTLQLFLFFNNVDFTDFIWGSGVNSHWMWNGREYGWLDNQIILTAWWAGVLPILLYVILFLKPALKHFFKRNTNVYFRGKAFILFLWFLALLGFSIYITISTSLYHLTMCFVLGNLLFFNNIRFRNAIK